MTTCVMVAAMQELGWAANRREEISCSTEVQGSSCGEQGSGCGSEAEASMSGRAWSGRRPAFLDTPSH